MHFTIALFPAQYDAKGDVTGQTVTATPASNTSASQQTVKAASLTVTKNSTPTDKTVIANSNGVLAGSWTFDATNSGENIRITSLAIRASTTGKYTALTLKDGTTTLNPVNDNPTTSNDSTETSTFALTDPIIVTKGESKVIDLYVNVPSNSNAGEVDAYGITTTAAVTAYGVTSGNSATVTVVAHNGALLTTAAAGTITINIDSSAPSSRLVVHGSTGVTLSEIRLKATNEAVDITRLAIRVADGALTGTNAGTFSQIKKAYLKLDGAVIGQTNGYSLGQDETRINFERGALTIPEGTTGKKLTISADIVELGTNQPGLSNADIKVGISGRNALTATGNSSNSAATETYTDSTGSAVILHKSVPSIVIETPSNKLGATAVLHRVKVSAVGNTVGLYRLTYSITSSTSVIASNYYTKLASCGSCGGVSDGSQLSDTDTAGDYLINTEDITIHTVSSDQSHGKRYLGIAAGATATIDLYASVTLTTNSDTVSTRLLGDTASTSVTDVDGQPAAAFGAKNQGNFVWSDLDNDDSQAASSLTAKQWFNGYYVAGLGPTTTSTPVTIGE